ncbi:MULTISPECIES: 7-cyano-7-deazaguanine synthase QueC [Marinobacter]|jgi:7-cyano-7-deazaguanine synthase|uniref:7-cyano-7-deazaguanine synthase QueC n=1 Tax=Marinobacter TaxID=2742 RepID=UPI0019276085|nr:MULTISPECIES: 7-cyano-7-deazaguanine synthase QueC [Marinobacter]MBL3823684.1 7-cyano-7-deazaguanine synthase QueC [Marinobacter sp. MC3]MBL3891840.1 7-cyano-7-deazaguanine synthase QueC [Marinobacter sp. MW3]MCD1646454.1 7-cyano-7-deazaguanine synthase QueC [Marinobacter adhaerens]
MTDTVVVIYSGGMDSYTLLHLARERGYRVHALSFNYGQRHVRELECARSVCEAQGIPHKVIDIRAMSEVMAGSSLTSDIDVPEGHYEEDSMKATVVPNRNMILLSLATGYAVTVGAGAVWYGAHGGDHAIYPDCRPEFVEKMDAVCRVANYEPVGIEAPFMAMDKGQILAEGLRLGLDYSQTWTCYNGREQACGRCGSCVERLEAFAVNGVTDPLEYEGAG